MSADLSLELPPLPQPARKALVESRMPSPSAEVMNADILRMRLQRMKKMPKTAARLAPVAGTSHGEDVYCSSACVAVVPITSVAVEEPPAASVTLPGLTAQVPSVGMPEQVSVTAPLKLALAARLSVTTL